jgi:hypothetical protein
MLIPCVETYFCDRFHPNKVLIEFPFLKKKFLKFQFLGHNFFWVHLITNDKFTYVKVSVKFRVLNNQIDPFGDKCFGPHFSDFFQESDFFVRKGNHFS